MPLFSSITIAFIIGIVAGYVFIYLPITVLILLIITGLTMHLLGTVPNPRMAEIASGLRLTPPVLPFYYSLFTVLGLLYYLYSAVYIPQNHISRVIDGDSPDSTTSLRSVGKSGTVPTEIKSTVHRSLFTIEGRVIRPPEWQGERQILYVDAERGVKGRVRLTVLGTVPTESQISYGDAILVNAKLRKPRGYHNFGGYSYEESLARDGIYVVGTAMAEDVRIIGNRGNPVLKRVYEWREHIRIAINKSFSEKTTAILSAMIIGDDRKLSDEIRDKFMASGTAHILSISGAHVGLLTFVFYNLIRLSILHLPYNLLVRLTLYTGPSKIAAIGVIPLAIFYTVIAGSKISAVRALIMIIVYLLSIVIERDRDWKNSIALAALITLLWNPQSLFDISFQLSYVAVVFIGYAIEYSLKLKVKSEELKNLKKKTVLTDKVKSKIFQYSLITIAATLGTAPAVAYYFNQFTWTGLFSNLIIIPLTGVLVLPSGLFASLLSLILNTPAIPFSSIIEYSVILFYQIVEFFAHLPYSVIRLPSPSILIILLYYILLWGLAKMVKIVILSPKGEESHSCFRIVTRFFTSFRMTAASLLIILLIVLPLAFDKNALKVTFLDVGQGDSILVELPDKKRMLIDGGGIAVHRSPFTVRSFDIGRRVVAPYLYDRRIRHIDYLVVTHPHPDHVGGLIHIVKEFSIGEVWTNGYKSDHPLHDEFIEAIKQKGIKHKVLWAGDAIKRTLPEDGDYQIYILHPHKEFTVYPQRGEFSAQNNLSLVIKIAYNDTSFLFTGDIEEEAEAYLIQLGKWVKSTLIKVPHHGGKTSSTESLLHVVSPQIAVVHVGRDNPFGHPNPEVVERYRRYGIRLYRTDMDGAVMITSDGKRIETLTYRDVTMVPVIGHYTISDELKNIKRILMHIMNF